MGVDIYLGRTHKELCPITAILSYMSQRGSGPGPLFKFADGKPLTKAQFVAKVREALTQAVVDCTPYSGHIFRIGAATTAASQGIEENNQKCWDDERVVHTSSTYKPRGNNWQQSHRKW